jgi:hypothetical protein
MFYVKPRFQWQPGEVFLPKSRARHVAKSTHSIPINTSSYQSPHVMMTPHHMYLYPLFSEQNQCNHKELHRCEEHARGAA